MGPTIEAMKNLSLLLALSLALPACRNKDFNDPSQHRNSTGASTQNHNSSADSRQPERVLAQKVVAEVEHSNLTALANAKRGTIRADLVTYSSAIKSYAIRNGGSLPEELKVLTARDSEGYSYMEPSEPLLDPYGNEYHYKVLEGIEFELLSFGKDGQLGGEGEDADLSIEMVLAGE